MTNFKFIESSLENGNSLQSSKAVIINDIIYIAGTVSLNENGEVIGKDSAYKQTKYILQQIAILLREGETGLNNVFRLRIFMTNISYLSDIEKALSEYFKDSNPIFSVMEVAAFRNSDLLVQIEAEAVIKTNKW